MQSDKSNKFSFSKGHRKNSVQTGYSVKLAASLSSDRWDASILICHQRSSNPIRSSRNFHWFFQLQLYIHEVKAVWKTDLPEKLMEDIPPWTGSPQQSWHYTISGGQQTTASRQNLTCHLVSNSSVMGAQLYQVVYVLPRAAFTLQLQRSNVPQGLKYLLSVPSWKKFPAVTII